MPGSQEALYPMLSINIYWIYNFMKLFSDYKIGLFPGGHEKKMNGCYEQQNKNVGIFKVEKQRKFCKKVLDFFF